MKRVTLSRYAPTDAGMLGQLAVDGFAFFTLEDDDWQVPPGVYPLVRTVWHKKGDTPVYMIDRVAGHDRIYLHWGNTEEDTDHCVLLGLSLGFLRVRQDEETGAPRVKLAVLQSRKAFEKFMEIMAGVEQAELEITGV